MHLSKEEGCLGPGVRIFQRFNVSFANQMAMKVLHRFSFYFVQVT